MNYPNTPPAHTFGQLCGLYRLASSSTIVFGADLGRHSIDCAVARGYAASDTLRHAAPREDAPEKILEVCTKPVTVHDSIDT